MNGFPDRRYFGQIASESGFQARPLETVFRLAELLVRIDARFGDELCLRGGTALNLLHLEVPRLSVDIDLDYVGSADLAQAQERRPGLLAELEALARAAGYEAAQQRASYAMAHLGLAYTDVDGRPASLKLDINFLDRVPVLPPERLEVRHPFGDDIAGSAMQTFALTELAAAKTIALVRRTLARDLFDVAMLAALPAIDTELLRTVLVVRGAGYPPPSPRDYTPQVIGGIRLVRWRSEVLALVRRPVPLSLEEARERAARFLRRATEFSDAQRDFLDGLDLAEIRAGVLPGEQLQERVARNPALIWRVQAGADALEER